MWRIKVSFFDFTCNKIYIPYFRPVKEWSLRLSLNTCKTKMLSHWISHSSSLNKPFFTLIKHTSFVPKTPHPNAVLIPSNTVSDGSLEPPSLKARGRPSPVARAGRRHGGVLRPRLPLLRPRLHVHGGLARRLRPPVAHPLLLRSASAPPRVGGHRGRAAARDRRLPRRHRRPHAVWGSEAEQPAE